MFSMLHVEKHTCWKRSGSPGMRLLSCIEDLQALKLNSFTQTYFCDHVLFPTDIIHKFIVQSLYYRYLMSTVCCKCHIPAPNKNSPIHVLNKCACVMPFNSASFREETPHSVTHVQLGWTPYGSKSPGSEEGLLRLNQVQVIKLMTSNPAPQ